MANALYQGRKGELRGYRTTTKITVPTVRLFPYLIKETAADTWSSDLREAAIDLEVCPVNVTGLIRGKERYDVGDLHRLRIPADGYQSAKVVVEAFQIAP